ncbi:MAG: hypothetical protein ACE3JQ_02545 [Paenisporosarcina sp.]
MEIKTSAFVGEAVSNLLSQENMMVQQMSHDINVSEQLGSHLKNNRRKMRQEDAEATIHMYDNPEYAFDILFEFSGGFTSPVLRGKGIEHHRLAVEEYAQREMLEALERMKQVSLAKPPGSINENERCEITSLVDELLDARVFLDNLLIQMQKEYGISIKKQIQNNIPRWKSKGWLK